MTARTDAAALVARYEHFRHRLLQDFLAEATADYWEKRAAQFAAVGNARCDEIAQACRNRAAVEQMELEWDGEPPTAMDIAVRTGNRARPSSSESGRRLDVDHPNFKVGVPVVEAPGRQPLEAQEHPLRERICPFCRTPTSPWTCSCGATRVDGAA